MKIHYLEVVTKDVDTVCEAFTSSCDAAFSDPVDVLGNARTAPMPDGSFIGVRSPMSESEEPVTRTYWLVDDIDQALEKVKNAGGEIAHPPLELPGYGKFAIYFVGGAQFGFWQL